MTDLFAFREGTPDCPYAADLELPVFFLPEHLSLQTAEPWHTCHIVHTESELVHAVVNISIQQGVGRSPLRSPFGSFLFSKNLPKEALAAFVDYVEARLRELGAEEVIFKNPPQALYEEQMTLLHSVFHQKDYTVTNEETGALIHIGEQSLIRRLDDWEKRKFFMGKKAGMDTALIPLADAEKVYRFIEESRRLQTRSLSLSYPEVQKIIDTFPERFVLLGVFLQDKMVAASINIQVTENVLYNFYGAHDHQYNKLSPMVTLMNGLYRYCQERDVRMLDLGTSSVHGIPNTSLLEFKKRLSAVTTPKLTFSKRLQA